MVQREEGYRQRGAAAGIRDKHDYGTDSESGGPRVKRFKKHYVYYKDGTASE